jgi:hypothetical protein
MMGDAVEGGQPQARRGGWKPTGPRKAADDGIPGRTGEEAVGQQAIAFRGRRGGGRLHAHPLPAAQGAVHRLPTEARLRRQHRLPAGLPAAIRSELRAQRAAAAGSGLARGNPTRKRSESLVEPPKQLQTASGFGCESGQAQCVHRRWNQHGGLALSDKPCRSSWAMGAIQEERAALPCYGVLGASAISQGGRDECKEGLTAQRTASPAGGGHDGCSIWGLKAQQRIGLSAAGTSISASGAPAG